MYCVPAILAWNNTICGKKVILCASLLQQLRPVNLAKLRRRKELRAKKKAVNWATRWRRRQLWWQRQHIAWQSYSRGPSAALSTVLLCSAIWVCECVKSERTLHDYRCHCYNHHHLMASLLSSCICTIFINASWLNFCQKIFIQQ